MILPQPDVEAADRPHPVYKIASRQVCPLDTSLVVYKILEFAEIVADVKLYMYQVSLGRRVIESVIKGEGATITALQARQSGKTETVACVCIGMAILLPALAAEFPDDERFMPFRRGFHVGVYAPVEKQAKLPYARMRDTVCDERVVEILSDPELDVELTKNSSDCLGFSNGSTIIARTASETAQIEGETHHLVIIEETQKMSRTKVEKEIRPMLASTNGTMCMIGTAWHSRGGFHISIQRNIEIRRRGGPRNHFEFPYDIVCKEKRLTYEKEKADTGIGNRFHLQYEQFVNGEIERLGGIDNEEFKMNYRCLWQESRVIAFSPRVLYGAQVKKTERGQTRSGFQVGGLDIGKLNDATVLTTMLVNRKNPIINRFALPGSDEEKQRYYQKTIIDWFELYGSFEGTDGQYNRLVEYIDRTGIQVLCVDATAIGNPVFERIQHVMGDRIIVHPVYFSIVSKSNLYKYYMQEFSAGRIRYVAGPETQKTNDYKQFIYQHEIIDKVEHGQYVTCEAPEGEHDDYPDSAALACWAEKIVDEVMMPEIEVISGSSFSKSGGGGSRPNSRVAAGGGGSNRYSRRW